jgi:hypothetical protein
MVITLATTNPAQVPHAKNGEQPPHSFSVEEDLVVVGLDEQSSAQHGRTVNSTTISENNIHKNFTQQM